ncbi:DAK2 domain-containing protein [Streptomyces sp. NPDC019224]|uniref:DAK2 domain-containing protein n=1 Tax=Streptomyces sp. NPDC019224 TaxID=3154484 RepID=UPI0033D06C85
MAASPPELTMDVENRVLVRRDAPVAGKTALTKEPPQAPGAVLTPAGRQLIPTVGGASGPLHGTLPRRTGKALGDAPAVSPADLARALGEGVSAVARMGGARAGDKTMPDAPLPAVGALGISFAVGREAARAAAGATVPLLERKGRASHPDGRSIGHQDPGATSAALPIAAPAETAETAGGGAGA